MDPVKTEKPTSPEIRSLQRIAETIRLGIERMEKRPDKSDKVLRMEKRNLQQVEQRLTDLGADIVAPPPSEE